MAPTRRHTPGAPLPRCCRCGETRPEAFYPSQPRMCRTCHYAYCRARRRTPEGRAENYAINKRWRQENPEKLREQGRRDYARKRERLLLDRITAGVEPGGEA